jgi:hypothetical protein
VQEVSGYNVRLLIIGDSLLIEQTEQNRNTVFHPKGNAKERPDCANDNTKCGNTMLI